MADRNTQRDQTNLRTRSAAERTIRRHHSRENSYRYYETSHWHCHTKYHTISELFLLQAMGSGVKLTCCLHIYISPETSQLTCFHPKFQPAYFQFGELR